MRILRRSGAQASEEESVFVTMTDMTISFLLIVMILLAFVAVLVNDEDAVSREVYDQVVEQRDSALEQVSILSEQLRSAIRERDRLQEKVNALLTRIEELEAELSTVTLERDAAMRELNLLRLQNEMYHDMIKSLTLEIERLREELAKAMEELELRRANQLELYMSQAITQRELLLEWLRDELHKRLKDKVDIPNLKVVISPETDALRFTGEGLFEKNSDKLKGDKRTVVNIMGDLLDEVLVCHTLGERAKRGPDCSVSGNAFVEAVQIEGHTDTDGEDDHNLRLSTRRAYETFFVIQDRAPGILDHRNVRNQPVMSVSGYGLMRPVETNDTLAGKAANRRIDLRIIMYAPSTVEDVEKIGRCVEDLMRQERCDEFQ